MKAMILVISILLSTTIKCQQACDTLLPNQMNYTGNGIILNNRYLTTKDFKEKINFDKTAFKYYLKSKNNENTSIAFGVIGVLSLVASAVTINSKNNLSGKFSIGAIVGIGLGMFFIGESSRNLKSAICTYNS
jgi:hypothetical protein